MKICHFTSVHHRHDTRVFIKQCQSLSNAGNEVKLIVADGKGNDKCSGVSIYDVGKASANRLIRFFITAWKLYKFARSLNADIYHFHDPELLFVGLALKINKQKVIYDVHEDYPRQVITNKPYIPVLLRKLISFFVEFFELFIARKLDGIIAVTPHIADRFIGYSNYVKIIYNYPIVHSNSTLPKWDTKLKQACYVGSLSKTRGVVELIQSLDYCDIKLNLGGNFNDDKLEKKVRQMPSWKNVNYYGYVDRKEVQEILDKSMVGLVTLHNTENYRHAIPVKLFEYMNRGIPVIVSNIPKWKEIVEKANCGIIVDPANPIEISEAILEIINNPRKSKQLGENGFNYLREGYNWKNQEDKLINFYRKLLYKAKKKVS